MLKAVIEARSAGRGMVPTTLEDERRYNAFMRLPAFVAAVVDSATASSQVEKEVAALAYLRQTKDNYAPSNDEYSAACNALGIAFSQAESGQTMG